MKRTRWIFLLALALLLGGCRAKGDAAGYEGDIKKAQEIAVIPYGESQETKIITEETEIEEFVKGLDLEAWIWKPLPHQAVPLGSFRLSKTETQKLWQASGERLRQMGTLTLYTGGYIRLTIAGLKVDFAIGNDAAAYLADYFA